MIRQGTREQHMIITTLLHVCPATAAVRLHPNLLPSTPTPDRQGVSPRISPAHTLTYWTRESPKERLAANRNADQSSLFANSSSTGGSHLSYRHLLPRLPAPNALLKRVIASASETSPFTASRSQFKRHKGTTLPTSTGQRGFPRGLSAGGRVGRRRERKQPRKPTPKPS